MMTHKKECVCSYVLHSDILVELFKSCEKCDKVLIEKSYLFFSVPT